MKYAWIKDNRETYPISQLCGVLQVSRSGYYDWLKASPTRIAQENKRLAQRIKALFMENHHRYGARRIKVLLAREGINASRRRIGRLMKAQGLYCRGKRRFKVTTQSRHHFSIAPNLLDRQFTLTEPNCVYVVDITYIRTQAGWLYLAVVMDLFSRRIVGWSMSSRMKTALVNEALLMALWQRKPKQGLLWHTDRGSQYASETHRRLLKAHGIIQSMSGKGDCWDNSVAESFFKTLKTELIHQVCFQTREEAKRAIFQYIEVYYNQKRLHSTNNYLSPVEYENWKQCA